MSTELETLTGTIDKFYFQNAANGYAVFVLQAQAPKVAVTVTGFFSNIHAGQHVRVTGKWIYHAKFGKQFEAQYCFTELPATVLGLKKYLSSGLIKGIGPAYADKLIAYFGADIITVIEKNPKRLLEVDGIGEKRVEKIVASWHEQKDISHLMMFLQERGITPALAARIYKHYKQQAIELIQENPYRLADEVWGIGFKTADEVAQKLGFATHCPHRLEAGIVHCITLATQQGHLYLEHQDLLKKTAVLLELTPTSIENADQDTQSVQVPKTTQDNIQDPLELLQTALTRLLEKDKLKMLEYSGASYCTLSAFYASEKGIAHRIETLLSQPSKFSFNSTTIATRLFTTYSDEVTLNEDQQGGVLSCFYNKITIITGGPGTGKTTLIKKLLILLDFEQVNYKLAAPTGRAAKRIIEGTGRPAVTVHRLLEYDSATASFIYNERNTLKVDFLIIDEASMLDVFLAYAIFKALPPTAHLVLIGDVDQLPSVGPGNVLSDLIQSKKITCIRLTQIFRQAQGSLITLNAHRINNGEFPLSTQHNTRTDFIFIKEDNPEALGDILKKLFFIELTKHGMSPEHAMVLTPMHRGAAGTIALNHILQGMLNPHYTYEQATYAGTIFKRGDKVMQIRNNYEKQVYNGDVGIIDSVDLADKLLMVNYGDQRFVAYEFEELNELVLAYAISIHKSQGSEYPAIIVPLFMQHFLLLQRNLIYTALTRAKRLCIFVGQSRALAVALRNTKGTERTTFLQKFLCKEL